MWDTGTSFALGAPVNSTKEQKTNPIPFSASCALTLLITADFSAIKCSSLLPVSVRHSGGCLFADQTPGGETSGGKRFDQLRRFAGGDQFRHALSRDRCRLEPVSSPTDVHIKVAHFRRWAHDRREIRRHVTDAGPLSQNAYSMQLWKQ